MKKFFLVVLLFVVLFVVACGDSSTPIESVSENGDAEAKSSSLLKSSSSSEKVSLSSRSQSSSSEESQSFNLSSEKNVVKGTFTDSRDKQTYKTVFVGSQTWMAQNLNYETENSFCYNNYPSNCSKYGRLYTWSAAMDSAGTWSTNGKECGYKKRCTPTYPVRGVCPTGWHLPTHAEFNVLFSAVGGPSTAGKMLKSTSGWKFDGDGLDVYSFSALPVGFIYNYGGGSYYEGAYAGFWSSDEIKGVIDRDTICYAFLVSLYYDSNEALLNYEIPKNSLSVRCVKD